MKNSFVLLVFIASFSQAQIPANLALQQLYTLSNPLTVRHAGDGSGRIFTITKGGTIRIYDGSSLLTTPFLDITSKVRSGNEQGLLGLDFDPNYSSNGYFYVYYTQETPNTGDTIVERYKVSSGNPNVADPNSGHILLRIDQPASHLLVLYILLEVAHSCPRPLVKYESHKSHYAMIFCCKESFWLY